MTKEQNKHFRTLSKEEEGSQLETKLKVERTWKLLEGELSHESSKTSTASTVTKQEMSVSFIASSVRGLSAQSQVVEQETSQEVADTASESVLKDDKQPSVVDIAPKMEIIPIKDELKATSLLGIKKSSLREIYTPLPEIVTTESTASYRVEGRPMTSTRSMVSSTRSMVSREGSTVTPRTMTTTPSRESASRQDTIGADEDSQLTVSEEVSSSLHAWQLAW